MSSPGIRYERLLFWAAPITIATCAVFISALGYNTQEDRVIANCYESTANTLKAEKKNLDDEWLKVIADKKKNPKYTTEDITFSGIVAHKLIYVGNIACWGIIKDKEINFRREPDKIIEELISTTQTLRKKPVQMYGIEIPDVVILGIAGTKVQIAMSTFIQSLQIALAPVMLLWLGSLYHTRIRELLTYKTEDSILKVHPHVINIFPVGHYPDLRKKNFFKSKAPILWATFSFLLRASLLVLFIAPSVALYVGSLFFQPIFNHWGFNILAGIWIVIYSLGIFLVETLSADKHFLGPSALR